MRVLFVCAAVWLLCFVMCLLRARFVFAVSATITSACCVYLVPAVRLLCILYPSCVCVCFPDPLCYFCLGFASATYSADRTVCQCNIPFMAAACVCLSVCPAAAAVCKLCVPGASSRLVCEMLVQNCCSDLPCWL